MGLCWPLTKNLCWSFWRCIFICFRSLAWLICCRFCVRCKNNSVGSYEKTAHVFKVWGRHKLDLVLQPSGTDNFILAHSSFENPEYVLKDYITLYYVTKDKAVFVETNPDVDVTRSEHGAFVRIAQFRRAKKVIVMPMHAFHKLGEKVGPPKGKVIFVCNTSRCGSTLLTQVFEETGKSIAYSEPDAMNAITQLEGLVSDEERDRIVIHSVNLLCKPISREILSYVLKLTQPSMVALPHLIKLYPEAYNLFMYRDGLKVSQSLARAANGMPLLGLTLLMGKMSPKMTKKIVLKMGLPADQFEKKVLSPLHFCSIVWAAAMRQYLDFVEEGIKVVSIRYEDMAKDTKYAFRKIFEYWELPFDEAAVEKAFGRDSQRDSPLSLKNLGKHKMADFTDEIKRQTDAVCQSFNVPCFPDPYITVGTITYRENKEDSENVDDQPTVTIVNEEQNKL